MKDENFSRTDQISHWLKGAAGTVGFGIFTEPAERMNQLARQRANEGMQDTLAFIQELARRVELAEEAPALNR